ncbi:Outer membrane protein OmpA [Mariprofundus aestuarium]|uniref:Outer membrane protein OmpA n=1 Tax=Mariprofundus aestuarium TaxID=1921086 RepID=A0A2K8L045_MARES|nr:OmpA family protein [Mariprofundus aestuarium]ATX80573.1 Outer membrane protein OmpA [Mariprofundus aestuarium]
MKRVMLLMVAAGLTFTGCATTPDDPNRHTKEKAAVGATIGAIAGAVIGHQQDRSGGALRGALIGGAAGGLLGAGVGRYMDNQEAEFKRVLEEERRANQIEVERLQNENLKITMNSEVSFDYNSAQLKPAFNNTLDKVADILNRYPRTTIKITGHTDSRGSTAYNQNLSEQRANAVGWYLADRGVDSRRVIADGRGELQPRATNDTEAGRQLNRRVEMLIVPDRDIQ